ncbi:MAG: VOC family protein [Acidimicrobiales bacterium]
MQPYPHGEVAVVVDCDDLERAAGFWAEVLGYRRSGEPSERYLSLVSTSGDGPELLLQKVPEPKAAKNRLHLDLRVRELAEEVERVVRAGATRLTTEPLAEGGWLWHVLADPDGNELCVLQPPANHWS